MFVLCGLLLLLSFVTLVSSRLQLLTTSNLTGAGLSNAPIGVDFTVVKEISLTALGVIDADAPGFMGTVTVYVERRSDAKIVVPPMAANASHQRTNNSAPFVFFMLDSAVRLPPSKYTLWATNFTADRYGAVGVEAVKDDSVVVTGAVVGRQAPAYSRWSAAQWTGGSLLFDVVPVVAPALVVPMPFKDCEAVACSALPSGLYNILGEQRYCDSTTDGGGWMRMFRLNETSCESRGWSSSRNPTVLGQEPVGCRPAGQSCRNFESLAPYGFQEARGSDVQMHFSGTPDGVRGFDGVTVRLQNTTVVWTFLTTPVASDCPCAPGFNASLPWNSAWSVRASGRWTCASGNFAQGWQRMEPVNSCRAVDRDLNVATVAQLSVFRVGFGESQNGLIVNICRSEIERDEDVTLSSMDLWVRPTLDFSTSRHCASGVSKIDLTPMPTPTSTSPPTRENVTSGQSVAFTTMASAVDSTLLVAVIVVGAVSLVMFVFVCVALALIFVRLRKQPKKTSVSINEMVSARDEPPTSATGTTFRPTSNYAALSIPSSLSSNSNDYAHGELSH
jgi:hypothetical protein